MTEEKSENREPTAFEKLQREYQDLCALYGHQTSQIDTLGEQRDITREQLKKCVKRSAQISKENQKTPATPMTEITEEAKDGTHG